MVEDVEYVETQNELLGDVAKTERLVESEVDTLCSIREEGVATNEILEGVAVHRPAEGIAPNFILGVEWIVHVESAAVILPNADRTLIRGAVEVNVRRTGVNNGERSA